MYKKKTEIWGSEVFWKFSVGWSLLKNRGILCGLENVK